jgi:hypothetical protein
VNANTFYEKDNTALFVSRHWKVKNSYGKFSEDLEQSIYDRVVIVEGVSVIKRQFKNCKINTFGNNKAKFISCLFENCIFETHGKSSILFRNCILRNNDSHHAKIDWQGDKP